MAVQKATKAGLDQPNPKSSSPWDNNASGHNRYNPANLLTPRTSRIISVEARTVGSPKVDKATKASKAPTAIEQTGSNRSSWIPGCRVF